MYTMRVYYEHIFSFHETSISGLFLNNKKCTVKFLLKKDPYLIEKIIVKTKRVKVFLIKFIFVTLNIFCTIPIVFTGFCPIEILL